MNLFSTTERTRGVDATASDVFEKPMSPIAACIRDIFVVKEITKGDVPTPPLNVPIATPFARSSDPTTE